MPPPVTGLLYCRRQLLVHICFLLVNCWWFSADALVCVLLVGKGVVG